ncbi:MAG: hypothetical protein E5W91_32445 [Mesorhizobium sp.]|uniref:hypothetical protein n=1 Tax=Mesorhizobium sp. TaxID=1871066 RepID=UPI00120B73A8|nr:hypothetical protein [Mesorhizobium sp.]TIS53098.1 MAG: hypothetical protein E5W91_32445 [Mesorhizobium sp.]
MPIQRTISPDLQKPEICAFLKSAAATYSEEGDAATEWSAEGYDFVKDCKRLVAEEPRALRTFRSRQVEVYTQANRLLLSPIITDPVDHNISMKVFALLFAKKGLDGTLVAEMKKAFEKTDFKDPALIADAENEIIKLGAKVDDYQIALIIELHRLASPEYLGMNIKTFVDQMTNYKDDQGKPVYTIKLIDSEKNECDAASSALEDGDIIEAPDVNDPEDAIGKYEGDQGHPCKGLVLTMHRMGTAFQYYEWKTVMEVREIRVGKCRIMKTKIPIIYSRIRKQALWGYVMSEAQLKKNLEKAIIDCLISSAIETGALAIVTGGMGLAAAAAAFASACQSCLESKVSDGVECLFSSLKLIAEIGEWKEKVF